MCLSCQLNGRLRLRESQVQASLGKKFVRLHLNGKKLVMMLCVCHPSYKKCKIQSPSKSTWAKTHILFQKYPENKRLEE
jgi:hypothetical protein